MTPEDGPGAAADNSPYSGDGLVSVFLEGCGLCEILRGESSDLVTWLVVRFVARL